MTWETILKAKKRPYQRKDLIGSIPHMFHFVTRMIRPKAEQNEKYLNNYAAWDELSTEDKTEIVKLLTEESPWKADWMLREYGYSKNPSIDLIPGVSKQDDTTLLINNLEYESWRVSELANDNNPSKVERDFPPESKLKNKDKVNQYWQDDWERMVKKYRRRIYRDIKEILVTRRKRIDQYTSRGY